MSMLPWAAAAVAALLAVVGWMRASAANARADAAEKKLAEAQAEADKLRKQLSAPAPAEPAPAPAPKSKPKPKPEPAPAPEPEPPPPEPEPAPVEVPPAVKKRAQKLVKQARDMARFMDLDKQVTVEGEKGYRVPVDLEDDEAVSAFEYLQSNAKSERYLLQAAQDHKGTFLVVKP